MSPDSRGKPRPAASGLTGDRARHRAGIRRRRGPLLALRPLERIALETQATVVATEWPRVLLVQWGLPVDPERAGEPVRAEMLYSSEGEPLALRILN